MQVVFYFPYPDHDVVIIDATAMITIFCTMVLSVIQGIALNTGILPFSKGKALHGFIKVELSNSSHQTS